MPPNRYSLPKAVGRAKAGQRNQKGNKMSRKILLLAASAVAVLAALALPTIAAATTPEVDFTREPTEANPVLANGTSGASRLTTVGGSEVQCSETHVTVTATSRTTGTVESLFTGCRSSGFSCTSSGQASGNITTNTSVTHLIYIKGFTKTVGTLTTAPPGGVFAEFNCTFLVHVVVTGNGAIGHVDRPACGEKSRSTTISVEQSSTGVQKYQEIEGSATKWHLNVSFNSGAAEEAAFVSSGTGLLAEAIEGTLTCP